MPFNKPNSSTIVNCSFDDCREMYYFGNVTFSYPVKVTNCYMVGEGGTVIFIPDRNNKEAKRKADEDGVPFLSGTTIRTYSTPFAMARGSTFTFQWSGPVDGSISARMDLSVGNTVARDVTTFSQFRRLLCGFPDTGYNKYGFVDEVAAPGTASIPWLNEWFGTSLTAINAP